jgi:hypothetical protein
MAVIKVFKWAVVGGITFTLAVLLLATPTFAQDIETLIKAPFAVVNGGVSLNQMVTFVPSDTMRQNPYSLFLAGNLNFNFFGEVNVPLSFSYSNSQLTKNASLPFNRFSISPSYKWVKVYAGYASMQFSPYTLAGHEIFGGGIEFTFDNGFKISAIGGELKEASTGKDGTTPAYQRMGGGFKVEYVGKQFDVEMNLFKAQDLLGSLPAAFLDSTPLSPQDNFAGAVSAKLKMVKNLTLGVEYAVSGLNQNISNSTGRNDFRLLNTTGDFAVFHAVKTNAAYATPFGAIGGTYERVAPNYSTLGAYYMTNDYQNITANFSTAIKKINLAVDVGHQTDNLDKQKTNTTSRMIYSGSISAPIGQKLTLGANFSNMQSYVHINDVYREVTQTNDYQNLDTLEVTQLNYTASFNAAYTLQSTKEVRQGINANFVYQKSAEQQEFQSYADNDIYNASLAYQYSFIPIKLNASAGINYTHNQMPDTMFSQAITYNLSLQKVFWGDVKTSLTCTYSTMSNHEGYLSDVFNLRFAAGYVLLKRHNFSLNLATVNSQGRSKSQQQYFVNLAYSYVFNVLVDKKNKKWKLEAGF